MTVFILSGMTQCLVFSLMAGLQDSMPLLVGRFGERRNAAFCPFRMSELYGDQFFELQVFILLESVLHTCLVILRLAASFRCFRGSKKCYFERYVIYLYCCQWISCSPNQCRIPSQGSRWWQGEKH